MQTASAREVTVRRAEQRDASSLMTLRAQWRDMTVTEAFASEFTDWFEREGRQRWWWVAEDRTGRAAGMVNLKVFERMPSPGRSPSRWGYLGNLFVHPVFRGKGVGTQLLTAVLDTSRAEGLVRVVLSPTEGSMPLYGRAGFVPADMLLVWHSPSNSTGA